MENKPPIKIFACPQSLDQAGKLLAYADYLIIGEDAFGLRLSQSFSRPQQAEIISLAQAAGKEVILAVNRLLHNQDIENLAQDYLPFAQKAGAKAILTGDPGALVLCQDEAPELSILWDTQTLNTSSGNLNFWAKEGVKAALLANELPQAELAALVPKLKLPAIIQVYGAVGVQDTRRKLISAYQDQYGLTQLKSSAQVPLYLQEVNTESPRLRIYENAYGTQVFSPEDLSLLPVLADLYGLGIRSWYLPSIFQAEASYLKIVALFYQAKEVLEAGTWSPDLAQGLEGQIRKLQPVNSRLGLGFYSLEPQDIS